MLNIYEDFPKTAFKKAMKDLANILEKEGY